MTVPIGLFWTSQDARTRCGLAKEAQGLRLFIEHEGKVVRAVAVPDVVAAYALAKRWHRDAETRTECGCW
jgi:hypothetical protein